MHRVLTVVEGFTERAIVEQTFAPYLGVRGLSLHAKVIGKPGHKGGVRSFEAVRKEILALLRQERGSRVSTMFDYYAPIIVKRIGVERLRQACPQFHEWGTILEGIAP